MLCIRNCDISFGQRRGGYEVVVANAGTEHKWRVEHAVAVEKALRAAPASLASVVAAVRAVASDVKPGKMPDADFLTATAEGLVFEALVHTMGLVSQVLLFLCL